MAHEHQLKNLVSAYASLIYEYQRESDRNMVYYF